LAEVAADAGVSVSTVSAVLNNRSNCWASAETRGRVAAVADQLGYRPNHAARALRYGTTQTLGLITTALDVEVTMRRIQGVEAAARAAGFQVTMSFDANDAAVEDRLVQHHVARGVEGFVVFPTESGVHQQLRQLARDGRPVVTFDGCGRFDFADDVSFDYARAGRLQAQHLMAQGRRCVALLTTEPCAHVNTLREGAARAALAEGGCTVADVAVALPVEEAVGFSLLEAVYPQIRSFIADSPDVDGLIAYDQLASLAVRAAFELGKRVPEDLAVVGMDDATVARYGAVPLTTVALPAVAAGRRAFALLAARLTDDAGAAPPCHEMLAPELCVRQSTVGATPSPMSRGTC
jgi:LacI family transcriptional regulator